MLATAGVITIGFVQGIHRVVRVVGAGRYVHFDGGASGLLQSAVLAWYIPLVTDENRKTTRCATLNEGGALVIEED